MELSRPTGRHAAPARNVLDTGLPAARPRTAEGLHRVVRPLEGLFNRVYGSRWNPLYRSGSLALAMLGVTLLTGIYLFIFYKVADPYGSVAALDATWHGSFMRSLHRYSADIAVVAVAVHALKMFLGGRTWGPRSLAWRSGILLLGSVLFCGWTGLVMAWDVQGQWVAWEGARLIDLLPVFSEPISRSFVRPGSVGRPFFFTNLFLHVALPLAVAGLLWLHASRVARPALLPPKKLLYWSIGAVAAISVLVPVPLPPEADLLSRPVNVPLDVFYAFWLPLAGALPAWGHLAFWLILGVFGFTVPNWWRPKDTTLPSSYVEEERCTACSTCYEDCPFDAISMVMRDVPSTLSQTVARVDPSLCLSCGICSGSCAPMGVGPPDRTGREQLHRVRELLASRPVAGQVAVVACRHSLGEELDALGREGMVVVSGCSGSVHTSSLEMFLHGGATGVFVITCPDRDCLYREGPKWLDQRVYFEREAELQARVDRSQVRLGAYGPGETARALRAVAAFRDGLGGAGPPQLFDSPLERDTECEVRDAYLDEPAVRME